MKRITILGIACTDVIVSGLKAIPEPGVLNHVNSISLHTGGCAVNSAIDLAKMGIKSNVITPIGNDEFGHFVRAQLEKNDVDTSHIFQSTEHQTSSSIVLIHPTGERSFIHDPGANAKYTEQDVDLEIIKYSDILFIAGALAMKQFDGFPMSHILEYAQKNNVFTVLDTVWDPSGKWMKTLEPCMQYIDLFSPSLDEAKMLSGLEFPEEIIDFFKSKGAKNIIIKMGKIGAYANINGKIYSVSSVLVENPVDTTGAGDAFMSGIITGLSLGWTAEKMLKFANVVGSLCIRKIGASSGILPLENIVKIMEENYREN